MKNQTFRLFSLVAYDESDTMNFNNILNNIIKHDLKYFYVYHFKEHEEEKNHYHIMIYIDSATTISKVANLLEIEENYIRVKDHNERYTLKKSIGYFLHYNNKEKIEYHFEDIKTNCVDLVKKYYDILTGGNNESNELKEIISFIEDNQPTSKNLLKFCIDNNLLKTFKKYSYVLYHITNYER